MGFTEDTTNQPDFACLGHPRPAGAEKYLKFLLDGYTLIPTLAVYMTGEPATQSGGI